MLPVLGRGCLKRLAALMQQPLVLLVDAHTSTSAAFNAWLLTELANA